MSDKIRKLFERRLASYEKYTNAIQDALTPTVLGPLLEVLELTGEEIGRLHWHAFQLMGDHLYLSGIVSYESGEEILADDGEEVITLDQKTALILSKLIKIALPIEVVENASKEEMKKYLIELQEQYKEEYAELYNMDPNVVQLDLNDYEGDTIEEKLENALMDTSEQFVDEAQFQYDELTEEQQAALRLSRLTQAGNKGDKIN